MCVRLLASLATVALPLPALALPSVSTMLAAPADRAAITVKGRGDGIADDTAAIQRAIDAAQARGAAGIVFLPAGRYRLTRTLLLREGVRLYGVGATRPVLLLAPHSPGFASGVAPLIVFTGGDQYEVGRIPVPVPGVVPAGGQVRDANSATFYSAMSNIDVEVGAGNPAAAAIRFRVAQHGFLSHMDFRLGDAFAGVYQAGNVMTDVHFHGGRYGIVTEKTSPAWPFTLIDSTFDGQRDAAIREHEAGLTLVNVAIADTPVGIDIDRGYGDWLWGKDVRFARVAHAAILISDERSAYTQIGFENAFASDTPVFARSRDGARPVAGAGARYRVASFASGLTLAGLGTTGRYALDVRSAPIATTPPPRAAAIRALPPVGDWVDVHSLGVRGDGITDDTVALQRAIDSHPVLYLPTGFYRVTDTLRLRADTVLIGLHPKTTQIFLPDNLPGYAGAGDARALVEAPRGGRTIVSGVGLFTGRINPRATALLWQAGADSLVDDVKIHGGGGTLTADGKPLDLYARAGGDPVANDRWDAQFPSIWVTNGGGGTFNAIWSPNTFAQAGFYVSNTRTPGHVYELSAEHHVRNEIVLDGVENWEFLAPQTEQEVGEGSHAVSLEMRNSRNILIANYHAYRVTRTFDPAPAAVLLYGSADIRFRNVHVNAESGYATCDAAGCGSFLRASKFPFADAIQDRSHGLAVREREFAVLDVPADPVAPPPAPRLAMLAPGAAVAKLADGFHSISGAAVDAAGALYFVERRFQRIYRWSAARGLELVSDAPIDPVNLALDRSGALMILSGQGAGATVYALRPDVPGVRPTVISATPAVAHPRATMLLPVNWWNNGEFRDQLDVATGAFTTLGEMFVRDVAVPKPLEYVSADGSLVLPAFRVFQQGPADRTGWRWSDTLDAHGLVGGMPGERVFVTNESQDATFSALIGAGGSLTDVTRFATRGGESVAAGPHGAVFVANGQVFVYDAAGKPLGRIDVPERPLQLVFGGADRRTLFILTHHALYSVRV